MKVGHAQRSGIQIVEILEPIIDINNISDFRDVLEEQARESRGPLILDLRATGYVGSVGLGMISLISLQLSREQRKFAVVIESDEIKRLFEISGLQKVMQVEEDLEAAIQKLGTPA